MARALGWGRVGLGVAVLAAPVASLKILGVDTATAKRVTYLARMMGARDLALGGGTVAAGPRAATPWLLAGAGADVVDACVITAAIKTGKAGGPLAGVGVLSAAGGAVLGLWAAATSRRR